MIVASAARDAGVVSFGVVIVNWRNAADTLRCLDSLMSASPRPDRVLLVDNCSEDHSLDRFIEWASRNVIRFELMDAHDEQSTPACVSERAPWLTIVRLGRNRGFAGGNNAGLALLERDSALTHFLLLNNDAVVARDYFSEMNVAVASLPNAGLCTGTIYELANPGRVWYAGGRILPLRALVTHEISVPTQDQPVSTQFVTGCAMVIARAALERVGKLAECYFPGYMEDAEYSWRVRASGLDLVYVPRALVYHQVGATFGHRVTSALAAYHQNRHRLFFVRRNFRGATRAAAIAYMAFTKCGRALIDFMQGRPDIGLATLRGTWAGLVARPDDGIENGRPPHEKQSAALLAGHSVRR
jgi:GT2 family glycosyltransferase